MKKFLNQQSINLIGNFNWFLLLLIEFLIIGYYIFQIKPLHYDEFESIHAGWKILNGEKIYEEFDELHHPLLYFILAIIIKIFGEKITTIYISSIFIFLITLGIIYYTFLFSKKIFDHNTAKISTIFLPLIPWFTLSAFEIRPDVPMLFFGIVSLYYLYCYFSNKNIWFLIISAISLGISFLFLQKAVFFFILIGGILIHRLYKNKITLKEISIYAINILFIYAVFLLVLLLNNISLNSYFFFCFEFPQARSADIGGLNNLVLIVKEIIQPDRIAWLIFPAFIYVLKAYQYTSQQKEIAIAAIWLLFTIFFAIVPYDQYFLPTITFVTIFIAYGFVNLAAKYIYNHTHLVLLILIIIGSFNYYNIVVAGPQNRDHQITRANYVLKNTKHNDYVYDGCNMYNLYRKDLDFFWYAGHEKIPSYVTYSSIKQYNYNIYQLIDEKNPKIISPCFIDLYKYKWILNRYRKTSDFDYLYIRYNNNTGFNHWYTFVDDLGLGSSIDPDWNFFTKLGNIEVTMVKASDELARTSYKNSLPFVGIGVEFNNPPRSVDLSKSHSIILNYKLTGPVSLLLVQDNIPPGSEHRVDLPPSENYNQLTLSWDKFYQPAWINKPKPLNLTKVTGIKFQITTPEQNNAFLSIGEITFNFPDN